MKKRIRQQIVVNLSGGKVRRETMDGRQYFVAPAAMLAEVVAKGSEGRIYYPRKFVANMKSRFDHMPLVYYHPRRNGKYVSARKPDIIERRGLGLVLNTKLDNKLRPECWFDEEKTNKIDPELIPKIERGEQVEISTGFLDVTVLEKQGEYNGEPYDCIALDANPDHLAVLPSGEGAYSCKAGGGILANQKKRKKPRDFRTVVNELSLSQVSSRLQDSLAAKFGEKGKSWYGWVTDVYDSYVVFCQPGDAPGQYWMADYTKDGDSVALSGSATKVMRELVYKTPDGEVVGNQSEEKETNVDKKKIVDGLIANGDWKEADRSFLEGLDDGKLAIIAKPVKSVQELATETIDGVTVNASEQNDAAAKKTTSTDKKTGSGAAGDSDAITHKATTWKEVVANASPEMQSALTKLGRNYMASKKKLVDKVVANTGLTVEEAAKLDDDVLEKLAAKKTVANAEGDEDFDPTRYPGGAYYGSEGGVLANVAGGELDTEPLIAPNIFETTKK